MFKIFTLRIKKMIREYQITQPFRFSLCKLNPMETAFYLMTRKMSKRIRELLHIATSDLIMQIKSTEFSPMKVAFSLYKG